MLISAGKGHRVCCEVHILQSYEAWLDINQLYIESKDRVLPRGWMDIVLCIYCGDQNSRLSVPHLVYSQHMPTGHTGHEAVTWVMHSPAHFTAAASFL